MPLPALATREQRFAWSDYQNWPDDERWELIDGVAYAMTPTPSIGHQSVLGAFFSRVEQQLRGHPCRPFLAPTDVKLSDTEVVQPDLLLVCDPHKITKSYIGGAPDLIVEVLSPSTSAKDLRQKKRPLYERSLAPEYLIVDPLEQYAIRFLLGADGYDKGAVLASDEQLTFATLEQVVVPLREVFELPAPKTPTADDENGD